MRIVSSPDADRGIVLRGHNWLGGGLDASLDSHCRRLLDSDLRQLGARGTDLPGGETKGAQLHDKA